MTLGFDASCLFHLSNLDLVYLYKFQIEFRRKIQGTWPCTQILWLQYFFFHPLIIDYGLRAFNIATPIPGTSFVRQ